MSSKFRAIEQWPDGGGPISYGPGMVDRFGRLKKLKVGRRYQIEWQWCMQGDGYQDMHGSGCSAVYTGHTTIGKHSFEVDERMPFLAQGKHVVVLREL